MEEFAGLDPRLVSYLYYFNIERDYFECHEYGESLWLDCGRPEVLKGLIQAAVCLYHLQGGNVRGGIRMWRRAKQYVDAHRPIYQSIQLDQLIEDIDAVFARVPSDWYSEVVELARIKSLALPTVQIQIVNPEVARLVQTWHPEDHPLHE